MVIPPMTAHRTTWLSVGGIDLRPHDDARSHANMARQTGNLFFINVNNWLHWRRWPCP